MCFGLLTASLLLVACGDTEKNSTEVSQQVRPVTVIQGANQNNNSSTGLPIDPTKNLTIAAGATATALPPTPTPRPGQATTAAIPPAPTQAGGATAAPPSGGATAAPSGGGAGDVAAGQKVFTQLCNVCHPNGGRVAGIGPKLAATTRDEAYIRNNIRMGKGTMPAFGPDQVSDQQLNDIVAYIKNLK